MIQRPATEQLRKKSRTIRFADEVPPVTANALVVRAPDPELAQLPTPAAEADRPRRKSRMIRFEAEPATAADYDLLVVIPPPALAPAQSAPAAAAMPAEPAEAASPVQPAEPELLVVRDETAAPAQTVEPTASAPQTQAAPPAEPAPAPRHKLGSLKFYCRCGQKIMVRFPAPKPYGLCPRCRHRFDLPEGSFEYQPPAAPPR